MKIELELKPYPENTPSNHSIIFLTAVQSTVTGGFYWDFNAYLHDRQCFPKFVNNKYEKVVAFTELPNAREIFEKRNEAKNQMESVPGAETETKR